MFWDTSDHLTYPILILLLGNQMTSCDQCAQYKCKEGWIGPYIFIEGRVNSGEYFINTRSIFTDWAQARKTDSYRSNSSFQREFLHILSKYLNPTVERTHCLGSTPSDDVRLLFLFLRWWPRSIISWLITLQCSGGWKEVRPTKQVAKSTSASK